MAPRGREFEVRNVPSSEMSSANRMAEGDHHEEDADEKLMIEKVFTDTPIPNWRQQLTFRAMVTGFLLSLVFNFIVCKLNLTTGVIPSLNVAAGLLGFAMVKAWTTLLDNFGLLKQPFTRQENTVIQTCVVASSGIAFSSGTATYLLGMSSSIAAQAEGGNTPENIKKLHLGWVIGFLFVVSFVGLFSIVPLRKMMVLKYKLTYPSGTATAFLINSFHTPKGAKLAKQQVSMLFKSFFGSFLWAFFQWFYVSSDGCGFSSFPTFGLKAFRQNNICWGGNDLSIYGEHITPHRRRDLLGHHVATHREAERQL
ncbi:hypothetical protein CRG98_045840, partial [Punica granatum]